MPANSNVTRSRRILICGGYAALAVAFVLVGVIPYFRGVAAANVAIAANQREIDVRMDKRVRLSAVEKNIELLNRQVANYPRLVPDSQDLGPFLGQLSHELEESGLKDIANKALAPIVLGKSQKLPIELRGPGTFSQFHQFLVHLEHLPRMCSIGHLNVEADTEMSGKVNVELTLFIYNTKPI